MRQSTYLEIAVRIGQTGRRGDSGEVGGFSRQLDPARLRFQFDFQQFIPHGNLISHS